MWFCFLSFLLLWIRTDILQNIKLIVQPAFQCCGSMTFWGGSGSGSTDPCFWEMYPDPDPGSGSCYFRHWASRCQQKTNLTQFFQLITFWKVHLHHFLKIKSQKESQNSRNQGFSYYFCMMIEGSGSRAGSGSIPLTSWSGSGSRRPKNMWIRWIRIRIRIRNTAAFTQNFEGSEKSFPSLKSPHTNLFLFLFWGLLNSQFDMLIRIHLECFSAEY